MNKDDAMLTFLRNCATINTSPLYFNFGKAADEAHQLISHADDVNSHTPYIDGSVQCMYTCSIDSFKSVSLSPSLANRRNNNLEDMKDVQAVIDWLNTQNELRNYPDFGNDCVIDELKVTTSRPQIVTVNEEVNPPMAVYRITVKISYIDNSQRLWK